ncbi:MAG: DUF2309 domain-containing protein [Proteobacteria bacterium]|nr:DUF2309 domain-containing protein [Pseudomonadota bacterium]
MRLALKDSTRATVDLVEACPASNQDEAQLAAAIRAACARIAPLWPLSRFVAVNPFLGFTDLPFERAVEEVQRLTGARALMSRSFYRQAVSEGRIGPEDLAAASARARREGLAPERLLHAIAADPAGAAAPHRITTVADVLDTLSEGDRQVSRTAFMVDEISKWCAAYFDEGQAAWPAPWRGRPLYEAWRWSVRFDANARVMGVKDLVDTVATLPGDAMGAIAQVVRALDIPQDQWTDYLYRALFDVRGWAAYVRRLDWEAELAGVAADRLVDFLAIRVVWGYALFRQRQDDAFVTAWRTALAQSRSRAGRPREDLAADHVMHRAYEHAAQRRLIKELAQAERASDQARPALQAVFCIDVRSEVYRRALEGAWPAAQTLGFAGFFGMPMTYQDADGEAHAQCPVLLRPAFEVRAETPLSRGFTEARQTAGGLWAQLRQSAVSCFSFVEAFGLTYGLKLAASAAGRGHVHKTPVDPPLSDDRMDIDQRVALAENALRGMSLVKDFARLVLLVGHGSSTTNNPHAAGLECGACGGRSGAPNARYAAALLNDGAVRARLVSRGIEIPADTVFAAGLHNTASDELLVLDRAEIPLSHRRDLELAEQRFAQATLLARAERASLLGLPPDAADRIPARGDDWSQVRPEWGLARASAFIAAPRALTAGCDLGGRAFLHSYDRHLDPDLKVLEMILTAPLIVASWISLQYYGSTVDNAVFGAGDKTLHNVCGRIGVLEGNAGDLRAGLPLQSVHDGSAFVHEPVRLNVFIAAEPDAIAQVLARQPQVRALLDNQWLFLFTLDDGGRVIHRYTSDLSWETLT